MGHMGCRVKGSVGSHRTYYGKFREEPKIGKDEIKIGGEDQFKKSE